MTSDNIAIQRDETPPVDAFPGWESSNLDLLRTLAVLLVFVFHVLEVMGVSQTGGPVHQFGKWGVLLFFVHTSFVLMLSLERQARQNYRAQYLVFLVRRAFRLYPLSVFVVAFVSIFQLSVGGFDGGHLWSASFDAKTIVSNLLLVQNLTHTRSVLCTLWTLPYEIQMYLVLPLLFLVARSTRGVVPLLIIWLACGFLGNIYLQHQPYTDLPSYVPCFISGVIGYKLRSLRRANLPFIGWPLVLAATTIFFQIRWGVKVGWVLCLVVGVTMSQFREMSHGPFAKFCQVIARYSYGIYLTHFICIWFAFTRLAAMPVYVQWLAFVITATASPIVLYHTIEKPMIALGALVVRRWAERAPTGPMPKANLVS